ncbi:unnamed protein product [Phyllotreta striolata]|uniref:Sulfide:quinone oxidoreductase, mitochondrial n=1 Tax=Phyllotreta striolata TaxID=444603 RepID=A0A9P0E0A6_PHYSR|nr:unnamed protein product [Phyllotreta striolata]
MFNNTTSKFLLNIARQFSTTTSKCDNFKCKLLIVGGGSGGCATAAKFSKILPKNDLIVLEPSDFHYYQPLFTLVGGGANKIEDARRREEDVLPKNCTWIKDRALEYSPGKNIVLTENGHTINYDYLLVATGIELRYDKIPGLLEALEKPTDVCSIYSPKYASYTFEVLKKLQSGNAIFTFPNTPIKCPGAPQKICYLTDHYLRTHNRRNNVKLTYNTSLPVIFSAKTYADALWIVCKERDINVNLRTNLVRVNSDVNEAIFENLDKPEEKTTVKFNMLHVTPPMATPESLSKNKQLTNSAGFVDVNKDTMQHVNFKNVFAIGDCCSTPNPKTAAAAAAQTKVVFENMNAVMKGDSPRLVYDGYASCPLVTGDKCILAEFDYDFQPLETFPFNQAKEMRSMYHLKRTLLPALYWKLMLNGHWNGPAAFRKLMHLGFGK